MKLGSWEGSHPWVGRPYICADLICAVHLDTSRQIVASAFGKPLVVRIHGAWIFHDPICAVHLDMSRQLLASVFGITLIEE